MKAKNSLVIVSILLLLVLGLLVGCNRARSDAQIAGDVQSKIFSDSAVQSRQITVQSNSGVVTLSGYVASDAERAAAATDASQVEGVKTVVNNLQTAPQAAANTPQQQPEPEPQAQAEQQTPPPPPATSSRATSRSSARQQSNRAAPRPSATYNAPSSAATYNAPVNNTPPPPAPPARITVPEGSTLSVRLSEALDSEKNQVGDTFHGSLDSPVVVGEDVAIPAGADVQGRVVDVKSAGRFAGQSNLAIELTQVSYNGRTYPIHSNTWSRQGTGRGKSTAAKVGGGAALGALIGGIAGGGKGAAIGAAAGAGAGTGVSAINKGQQIRLNPESVVNFNLQSAVTVQPSATRQRGGQRLDTQQ